MKFRNEIESLSTLVDFTQSKFQFDHFVFDDQLTDFFKLKQVFMEFNVRTRVLDAHLLDLEEIEIKIEQLSAKKPFDDYSKRLNAIEIKRLELQKKEKENAIRSTKAEIAYIEDYYEKLKDQIQESISIEEFLSNLTEEQIEEYWALKFIKQGALDLLTAGVLSRGYLSNVSILPKPLQDRILLNTYDQSKNIHKEISELGKAALTA